MSIEIVFLIIEDEEQTKNGIKGIIALSDGGSSAGAERESNFNVSDVISISSFSTCIDELLAGMSEK